MILGKFNMIKNRALYLLGIPTLITVVSGVLLVSSAVLADDSVVDEINVTVPISCSMSGTGMNTHNANIMNGTYQPNIGTTVLHIFCNDSDGFAVYAAGYTGDAIGETNSNKLVGTSASSGAVIDTGLATSGGSPDVSNWAMKLAITQDSGDTTGTNTFVIDSAPNASGGADASFGQYHTVPNEYTKVAHKNSVTDMTASTGGVKLTTTYAAYISKTQAADTYSGQVKYTLVHPHDADAPRLEQVSVVFDGNGLSFPNGSSTNTVKYTKRCSSDIYVSDSYQEVMTSNVLSGGEQDGAYDSDEFILQPITIMDADSLKIDLTYSLTGGGIVVAQGDWDGSEEPDYYEMIANGEYVNGHKTVFMEGNTVTLFMQTTGVTPESNHDYGLYAKVYPAYNTERPNTTKEQQPNEVCSVVPISGTYMETTTWNDKWVPKVLFNEEEDVSFESEGELIGYISDNYESMNGTTFDVSAYNPTTVVRDFDVTYDTSDDGKLFFDEEMTQTQNTVNYSATCQVESRDYDVVKSSNLSNDGIKNASFSEQNIEIEKRYQEDVKKIKIIVRYGFAVDGGYISIGDSHGRLYEIYSERDNIASTDTFILENIGDVITITVELLGSIEDYDYGAYIIIQGLDENNNVMPIPRYSNCSYDTIGGTFIQPNYSISRYWFKGWRYRYEQALDFADERELIEDILKYRGPVNTTVRGISDAPMA